MAKITFDNKETLEPRPDILPKHKVTAEDINALKTGINSLYDGSKITYDDLAALKAANGLLPGLKYHITDRGDQGIVLQALTTNILSRLGTRLMLCPKKEYYQYTPSSGVLGVWRDWKGTYELDSPSTFTVGNSVENGSGVKGIIGYSSGNDIRFDRIENGSFSVGDTLTEYTPLGVATGATAMLSGGPVEGGEYCTWAGHIWENKEGVMGAPADEENMDSNWQKIAKSDEEYETVVLNVDYDFENDYINGQWDNQGNECKFPRALFLAFSMPVNPVETCDWNQASDTFVMQNIKTLFGFRNNCPPQDSGICMYSNIVAGAVADNDCGVIRTVRCNVVVADHASDLNAFAALNHNRCKSIYDINLTGGIGGIPYYVDGYYGHTDDESFGFDISLSHNPFVAGEAKYFNCIQESGVRLSELVISSKGVTNTTATITAGLEIDADSYLTDTTAAISASGVKVSTMSPATAQKYRRICIESDENLNVGLLKIAGKYL